MGDFYNRVSGSLTLSDLDVDGDLVVTGDTTTVSSTNLVVTDKLIELANGTSGTPSGDSGLVIERGSSDNVFIGWDETEDKVTVGTGSFTGASTGDLSLTDAALKTGAITSSGVVTATGFTIGSAVIAEAELEQIDGITAGTAAASKALVLDSNKDIGTIRNLTIDGTFSDGNYTFDTSGNVSGLGTVGCGAITSSGDISTTGEVKTAKVSFTDGDDAITIADGGGITANTSLTLASGATVTAINDEDNMTSNSATALATQQSIKAYVDSQTSGAGNMDNWVLEDDDGTEVTVSNGKEVKFIGSGLTTNFTDTDNGTDADPFDLTFTVNAAQTGITSVVNASLEIGRDADNRIKFGTDNQIIFEVDGGDNVIFKTGGEIEAASLDVSGDADIDGTLDLGSLSIDNNVTNTSAGTYTAMTVDFDKTGASTSDNDLVGIFVDMDNTTAEGGTNTMTGLLVTPTLTHAQSSGTTLVKGLEVTATGSGPGNTTTRALDLTATGADFNQGVFMKIDNGGPDIKMLSSASNSDFSTISTGANGELTIATTDGTGTVGHVNIDADGDITLDADGGTITFADAGSSLGTITSAGYSGTAAVATTVTITDNESTNEENAVVFTAGGDVDGGNLGLESDGDLTYNPSTGTLSATIFKGNVDAVDGDFDGTLEADAITVGGTNLLTGGVITSLGTITQDTVTFTSTNANDPQVFIKNTTNDASGPVLVLENDRGSNNGADNDICGIIEFKGTDDASAQTTFAMVSATVKDASNGAEGGEFGVEVATHDGEMQFGLKITDGDAEDELDVEIGSGINSVTTAAGYVKGANGVLVPEGKSLHIETPMLATNDHSATGITTLLTASENIAQGNLVYVSGNGTIGIADADAVAKMPAIGIAVAAISSGQPGAVLLQGMFRDDTFNFTAGNRLFASATDGGITATVPSGSNDVAQAVGVALSDDVIYFKPDMTLVEIS